MKYRKRPVVIEAFQWRARTPTGLPEWALAACTQDADGVYIETLEGKMKASDGDFIIKGVKGEIYPCKPDIFAATYDAVEDT